MASLQLALEELPPTREPLPALAGQRPYYREHWFAENVDAQGNRRSYSIPLLRLENDQVKSGIIGDQSNAIVIREEREPTVCLND